MILLKCKWLGCAPLLGVLARWITASSCSLCFIHTGLFVLWCQAPAWSGLLHLLFLLSVSDLPPQFCLACFFLSFRALSSEVFLDTQAKNPSSVLCCCLWKCNSIITIRNDLTQLAYCLFTHPGINLTGLTHYCSSSIQKSICWGRGAAQKVFSKYMETNHILFLFGGYLARTPSTPSY